MATEFTKTTSYSPLPPYGLHYNYKVYKYDDGAGGQSQSVPTLPKLVSGPTQDTIIPGTDPPPQVTYIQSAPQPPATPLIVESPPPPVQPQIQYIPVPTAPAVDPGRLNYLEDRLSAHEKNAGALIDHAFRVRDNIANNLAQSNWYDESQTRQLLSDHIHTITAVCKRLSRDIEVLESQLSSRDAALVSSTSGIKSLEHHHVVGIMDLKGRIARCDAAISQLAGLIKALQDAIRQLQAQIANAGKDLEERLRRLEIRVTDIDNDLQQAKQDWTVQIRALRNDTVRMINELDQKLTTGLEDQRLLIMAHKQQEEAARAELEGRVVQTIEQVRLTLDSRINEQDERLTNFMEGTNRAIANLDANVTKVVQQVHKLDAEFEHRTAKVVDPLMQQMKARLDKLKTETKDGFKSVQDSINNMRAVLDGKRKLLEDNLRAEIAKIRKAVVLA